MALTVARPPPRPLPNSLADLRLTHSRLPPILKVGGNIHEGSGMETLLANGSYAQSGYGLAMAIVAAVSLAVGLWVVARERARRISLLLLAGSTAIAVYLLAFSFLVRATDATAAHRWAHVAYLGIPLIVPALYHFSIDLLGLTPRRRNLIGAAWAVGFVYLILAQTTELLIPGVMETRWGYYTDLTAWNLPFLAWSVLLLGVVLRDYWNAYALANPVQRARIRWLAIPLLMASFGFADYLPSLGVELRPVGFAFLAAFPLAAGWVVGRYHLPDLTPAFAADQILRTMAEPILVVDQSGRVSITNPAAAGLLGWSREEMEGRSLAVLLGTETARRLTGETVHGLELDLQARTGEPIAVSISTSELKTNDRVVGTVIVASDIREQRRSARELERREQYFRALIENARDIITVLDARGRILYQSPSHARVLGTEPGKRVGKDVFARVHPDDRARVRECLARLAAEPGGTAQMEIRIRHENGEYRVIDARAQNLLHDPAVRGIVVNGRDITEERALAHRLQRAQKLEAIGRLAGGIAHDFNNILTTIQGAVSLLRHELPPGTDAGEELETIRAGAERASRLTNQLLAFGRRQMVRPETLDLNTLLRDLRSGLEKVIGSGRELDLDVADEASPVRIDRSQLEQALLDLVIHARDATEADGHLGITTANVRRDPVPSDTDPAPEAGPAPGAGPVPGRYVRVTIRHDGRGMDEEVLERVFEPFFDATDAGPGDGLGLASAYGVVRQAGGHIEAESRPGAGTTFTLWLPRAEKTGDEGDREPVDTDMDTPPERLHRGRILVVEDEAPVRRLIRKVLEREGYRVLEAEDGETALERASHHRGEIGLLIADLVMPGMSGRTVAERLGAQEPDMGTILISGYTADDIIRTGIAAGDYVFIPKPFSPEELVGRVAEVLRARSTG